MNIGGEDEIWISPRLEISHPQCHARGSVRKLLKGMNHSMIVRKEREDLTPQNKATRRSSPRQRQEQSKGTATPRGALDLEMSAMRFRDRTRDAEAQPGAFFAL